MTLCRRDREQIEVEIRLHPSRIAALEKVRREYAEQLPAPWSEAGREKAGNRRVDATWQALERLFRDDEYRRLVRVVGAIEALRRRLDFQCRRILESYYWDDHDMSTVAREIGASGDTVLRRRQEIVALALEELQRAGVATYGERAG